MNTLDHRFSVAPMMDWTDRHCRASQCLIESNAKRKMALRVGAAFFVSNQHFWGYVISFSTLGLRSLF
jgi:tRNA-dihydrouridine synthase